MVNFSDEVNTEIRYTLGLVRGSAQDEVHMDIRYEFIFSDEVYRFRYTTPQSCPMK